MSRHDGPSALNLEVSEGEVLGYLGPNGAGKTTTIRCLLGLVQGKVDATFTAATPPDLSRVPGVVAVEVEGNRVRCQVGGSVEPLLGVLAASGVHQLLSREPSLEELSRAHHGGEPKAETAPSHEP